LLAGVTREGAPVLALPGNPVSVLVTARRFALEALKRRAGVSERERPPLVTLESADAATIPLWWHRPVQLVAPGRAKPIASRGSGDVASVARSDGFIEVPPEARGPGPWSYLGW